MAATLEPLATLDMVPAVTGTRSLDWFRQIALEIAIALMLISGITPLAALTSSVEHVPYGLAVVVLLGKRPPLAFALTVAAATLFWTLSKLHWGEWANWVYLVQFTNVLTPLVFFHSLRPKIERTSHIVFWVYVAFTVLQTIEVLVYVESFFDLFIARFRGEQNNGYRGAQGLETEPARAAYQLLMLYVIGRSRFVNQRVGFAVLIVTEVVLIRATIGLLLLAVLVGLLALSFVRRYPKVLPLVLVGAACLGAASYVANPKIELLVDKTVTDGADGLNDSLTAASGGRFLALQDTVVDIARQPLGRGADPEFFTGERELTGEANFEGYKVERSPRPVSALLNAVRTFGIPIALLAAWAIRRDLFEGRRPDLNPYFWFVIFSSLFYGPSGSEALLIALGVAGTPQGLETDREPEGDTPSVESA